MRALLTATALGLISFMPLQAQAPYLQPDDSWITISGTVDQVEPDEFTLDYGEGLITVEMDDGDRDADAYVLLEGDSVTVTGLVDDDFSELTTIEVSSVHVHKLDTTFYSSAFDEEDPLVIMTPAVDIEDVVLQGTVTEVRDEEFVVNTGLQSFTVETEEMPYDPLDDEGYLRIDVGDVVSVTGEMDLDVIEGREIVAESILVLD